MYIWLILLLTTCSALAQTENPTQKISIGTSEWKSRSNYENTFLPHFLPLVILYEIEQDDVPMLMTNEIRTLENVYPHIILNDQYVTMEREKINETLGNRKFPVII